ncbi:MAG: hypothetical protein M8349_04370 [ANME-2 cluster archaeon]|nr:hypothetical protein [ANME-2 cluster archaeon]MDF1556800.1 hypothetical protein [ANME-2 cluster archaeon]
MALSRSRIKFKRYMKELMHKFRFTYEDISKGTGIKEERIRAINKIEDPTPEENMLLKQFSLKITKERGEDEGE